ncbi:anti-anti-sigma factor [Jatrophihabitans endophyticus]|uniref:Anti-sigma factor antagonist n=1 Tax=Jatrophihabitans endophyticus TaxID=1206085 RepID=A0A1M5G774_9ACTN|nr:STAS domain-containing protein [Jatrophihabitans endophyticus]SHF99670.1 anti-anti-sigma factor [Jatrophihabitans endophyticus]
MSSLSLSARRENGTAVLSLDGELDLATVPALRDTALAELGEPGTATLVLDLARLTFLDSTGIGCWIELRNHAEGAGKELALRAVPAAARRTVTIAGLAPVFGIDAS